MALYDDGVIKKNISVIVIFLTSSNSSEHDYYRRLWEESDLIDG